MLTSAAASLPSKGDFNFNSANEFLRSHRRMWGNWTCGGFSPLLDEVRCFMVSWSSWFHSNWVWIMKKPELMWFIEAGCLWLHLLFILCCFLCEWMCLQRWGSSQRLEADRGEIWRLNFGQCECQTEYELKLNRAATKPYFNWCRDFCAINDANKADFYFMSE